jgi:hypothetical protein
MADNIPLIPGLIIAAALWVAVFWLAKRGL